MRKEIIKGIVLFLVGVLLLSSPAQVYPIRFEESLGARRVREGEVAAIFVRKDVKVEELSTAQLEAIYKILPEGSRGREADNPGWFNFFLHPELYTCNTDWPYIVLLRDLETDKLTWHIFCGDLPIDGYHDYAKKSSDFRGLRWLERRASTFRGRDLEAIEIIRKRHDSNGKEYYEHLFFTKDASEPVWNP